MNEFDDAIENSALSEKSIITYGYTYDRLRKLLNDEPILSYSQQRIIKHIKKFDIPPMSKNSMVSVVMLIRKNVNLIVNELIKYRETLNLKHYKNKQKSNKILEDELPSIKTLTEYTNKLFTDEKYMEFIINYILLNFNTRNMDLDMLFLKDKKDANETDNYMYATTRYLVYVRQNYKTANFYGKQTHKIYNSKMIKAFNNLIGDETSYKLIETTNLNKFIQDKTYNGIGEGKYIKSVLLEHKKNGNVNGFDAVSKNRGTSLDVLYKDYKMN
jgi:hypothetical protein